MPRFVDKFHTPSVLVVITHFNNSHFIEDALRSVQEQTYTNFLCVVVDDCSQADHYQAVQDFVGKLQDRRFSVIRCAENVGQIHAFYRALEDQNSIFVSILDPDDRYTPEFLARMVEVHLNPYLFCPVVACDQRLLKLGDGVTTGNLDTSAWTEFSSEFESQASAYESCFRRFGFHRYILPTDDGWFWKSTSSIMFRTDAVRAVRPSRRLSYKVAVDAYCVNGAHLMGGSILLREALVYRGLHAGNDYLSDTIFTVFQKHGRQGSVELSYPLKIEAIKSFFDNKTHLSFDLEAVAQVLAVHLKSEDFEIFVKSVPGLSKAYADYLAKATRHSIPA